MPTSSAILKEIDRELIITKRALLGLLPVKWLIGCDYVNVNREWTYWVFHKGHPEVRALFGNRPGAALGYLNGLRRGEKLYLVWTLGNGRRYDDPEWELVSYLNSLSEANT